MDFHAIGSLLTFLLLLSVLIITHELGHFWVARRCGIAVERFGFGLPFGPTLWSKKIGDVEYCVHLFLMGGYVSFPDDNPDSPIPKDSPERFENQPVWNRFAVAIAGVTVNALTAWALMTFVFMQWGGPYLTPDTVVLATVKGDPAYQAGIKPGDLVRAVNGKALPDANTFLAVPYFSETFKDHKNQQVVITIERPYQMAQLLDIPVRVGADGKIGFIPEQRQLKVPPEKNPVKAFGYAVDFLNLTIRKNFIAMGQMFMGRLNPDMLSGPLEIISVGSETIARHGMEKGLTLTAIISMILAVMNLLPIPALDGGHILFLLIEMVKGSPLKKEVHEKITQLGFVGLMLLMLFVIANDGYKMLKRHVLPQEKPAVVKELVTDETLLK